MRPKGDTITVVGRDPLTVGALRRQLLEAGLPATERIVGVRMTPALVRRPEPRAVVLDIEREGPRPDGIDLLARLRMRGFRGVALVVADDPVSDKLFRAARAGADDFLVRRAWIDAGRELARLLAGRKRRIPEGDGSEVLARLGCLRSFGITHREIEVLREFGRGFPRLSALAARMGVDASKLRKVFSRIYARTGFENPSQVAHLVTACAMLGRPG